MTDTGLRTRKNAVSWLFWDPGDVLQSLERKICAITYAHLRDFRLHDGVSQETSDYLFITTDALRSKFLLSCRRRLLFAMGRTHAESHRTAADDQN